MGHLYNNLRFKKTMKTLHFSPNIWRSVYTTHENPFKQYSEKKLFSRDSVIPSTFCNHTVKVHSGKVFKTFTINKWKVGFKFGEFTWNRRYASYKPSKKK